MSDLKWAGFALGAAAAACGAIGAALATPAEAQGIYGNRVAAVASAPVAPVSTAPLAVAPAASAAAPVVAACVDAAAAVSATDGADRPCA